MKATTLQALSCTLATATFAAPVWAQEGNGDTGNDGERVVIDLTVPEPPQKVDQLALQQCENEADAARIRGEIIVCAKPLETTDGSWDKSDWEKRYAERTQGPKPLKMHPDPTPQMVGITFTAKFGPPPGSAPVLIDTEPLPQAPAGSDADRIARGLPPLGQDEELSKEEIRKRREALGLPPPKYEEKP